MSVSRECDTSIDSINMARFGQVLVLISCFICFHCEFAASVNFTRTIFVSPTGNDTVADCGSVASPCKTFDFALQKVQSTPSSTRIFLRPGNYSLKKSFDFTQIDNFVIYGEANSRDVLISCPKHNTSLSFTLAKGLLFKGFTLDGCGGWRVSAVGRKDWSVANPKFITALYINYCFDLTINQVNISNTPGVAVNIYSAAGTVTIRDSVFNNNVPLGSNETNISTNSTDILMADKTGEYAKSGGGMFLLLGDIYNNPLKPSPEQAKEYFKSSNIITITNTFFTCNRAPTPEFPVTAIPSLPFSRGGGLAIFITGNSSSNKLAINSCEFIQNEAVWGGGLQIELSDRAQNNTITVTNTKFKYNHARAEGGGLRWSSSLEEDITLLPNFLTLISCQIYRNRAIWGGALTTYGTTFLTLPNDDIEYQRSLITFHSCKIYENKGTVGAAIGAFLVNRNEDEIGPGLPYHMVFKNCSVFDNNVIIREPSYVVGQGSIYSDEVPLIFQYNNSIYNNDNTAVVLDSATMIVYNNVNFSHNSGFRGGALALYGDSKIVLMKHSSLYFFENHCDEKGGAMYVNAPGPPLVSFNSNGMKIHKCFFTYDNEVPGVDFNEWETEIIFQGNSVGDNSFAGNSSGRSVFASTLRDCGRVGETRKNNTALEWKFIKYKDKDGNPVGIKGEVVTEPIDIIINESDWKVSPSQVFSASMSLIDEKQNNVYGIIQVSVSGNHSKARLGGGSSLFLVYDKVANLSVLGVPKDNFYVDLRTTNKHLVHKTIKNLQLQPCNRGYYYDNSRCLCNSDEEKGIYNCSHDGHTIFIRQGYWAGMVDDDFYTHTCPESYCAFSSLNNQSLAYKYYSKNMCISSRESDSILCGSCKKNYTVLIGSEECSSECNNYYLLTIIPYAIIFFIAVMLIMLINLDVFTTYLNAWLYSYQVMSLLFIEGFSVDTFMQFIIGLANLQIKAGGSCLLTDITDADKLMLMYLLPTYILASVFILAKIVRRWPNWCYSRRVRAPFRALCTLFVLCYTNITSISLKILYPAYIGHRTVLFMDGEMDFFKGRHIAYAIVAIIYLLLVVIPCPLILMFTPYFTKLLMPIVNVNTLKPYYDAFQGCFKDEYRWCSAFYFVCRLYLLLVSIYMPLGPWKRALLENSCMIILALFVYLKPYKKEYNWLNLLDAVLLCNLGCMAIFGTAVQNAQSFPEYRNQFAGFIRVMSYVPLCYLICLLIYLAFQYRENIKLYMARKMRADSSTVLENYSETDPETTVNLGQNEVEQSSAQQL